MTRRGVPKIRPPQANTYNSETSGDEEISQPARQPPPARTSQPARFSRTAKGKSVASASAAADETQEEHTSHPWPRAEKTPFLDDSLVEEIPRISIAAIQAMTGFDSRQPGHAWDRFNRIFYNGLLQVTMAPTKFVCEATLARMGISDDVRAMLTKMGLGTIAYKSYPLYPELVRQFLASVEVRYKDIAIHTASEGTLSYLCRGVHYELPIQTLCEIYGFERSWELCRFPYFGEADVLWNLIATGPFTTAQSRDAKLSLIRNPVIRVVAKIIGQSFSGKEETGALRVDELSLIDNGLPDSVRATYHQEPPLRLHTNLGAMFAEMLVKKKQRGLNTSGTKKIEIIGSLLTPIFRYHNIDLRETECIREIETFNARYFTNAHILKGDYEYRFYDRAGVPQRCRLPLPPFTPPVSRANLEFELDPQFILTGQPRTSRSRRAAREQVDPPQQPPHAHSVDDPVIPEYSTEYDLLPLAEDASDTERIAWLVDSHRKQHTMLQKIFGVLGRLTCMQPSSSSSRHRTRAAAVDARAGPSVAGHGTSYQGGQAGETRLPRRRRAPGDSRSASSGEH